MVHLELKQLNVQWLDFFASGTLQREESLGSEVIIVAVIIHSCE